MIHRFRQNHPKGFRIAVIAAVLLPVLAALYVIRPVKSASWYSQTNNRLVDLVQLDAPLEQSFHTTEPAVSVTFQVSTVMDVIERGSLRAVITDSASGAVLKEASFPAEQLVDNAFLTVPVDLAPGNYRIAFSLEDFDTDKTLSLYLAYPFGHEPCVSGDTANQFPVNLELALAPAPAETVRADAIRFFRLSAILTFLAVLASVVLTCLYFRKKRTLTGRSLIRPALALAALAAALLLLALSFGDAVAGGNTAFMREDPVRFYLVLALLVLFIVLLIRDYPVSAWLFLFCVGLVLVFADTAYSIIDERAHTNLIQHITQHIIFPSLYQNYEAVQGPVYYYAAALLTGWLPAEYICTAGRIFGLVCLALFGWITGKTVRLVADAGAVRAPRSLLNACWLLFVMNPHILIRFSRVSNEALMAVFVSVAVFLAARLILGTFDARSLTACTVLCAVAFLTKSTSVFVFGLVFLVCAYHKKWKAFGLQLLLYFLLIAPWFATNLIRYHHLTGMQLHLAHVLPTVNPDMIRPDVLFTIRGFFSMYFLNLECGIWYGYPVLNDILAPLSLLMMIVAALIACWFLGAFIRRRLRFDYGLKERKRVLFLSFTALPVVSFIMHAVQSLMTYNNSLLNRYALMLNGVFACLLLMAFSLLPEKAKKVCPFLLCFCYAFFLISLLCGYAETLLPGV